MNSSCMINSPYPEVKIEVKNREKGLLLLPMYAGSMSEMTAVSDYFYQSIVSHDDPELSATLECIAVTEMKHLDLIGSLIYAFGVLPKLYSSQGRRKATWWSGASVDYAPTKEVFLRENIRRENAAVRGYETLKKKIGIDSVSALFDRIIEDEKHHAEIFASLL